MISRHRLISRQEEIKAMITAILLHGLQIDMSTLPDRSKPMMVY